MPDDPAVDEADPLGLGRAVFCNRIVDRVAKGLLGHFKRHFTTLAPMVRVHGAATPLTQRRFVRAVGGSMHGVETSVERQASDALRL